MQEKPELTMAFRRETTIREIKEFHYLDLKEG
jgi:hypothetical protein